VAHQAPTVTPEEAQGDQGQAWEREPWKAHQEATEEGQETQGDEGDQSAPRNAGLIPGPRGGLLAPRWTSENRPRGGRPKGPDAWATLCALKGQDAGLWAERIDEILCNPDRFPKLYAAVLKEYGDRILGPVERKVTKVEHKAAYSAYEVTVRPGPPDTRGALESGQGPQEGAVQRGGVASGDHPPLLGPGGPGVPFGSIAPPASSVATEREAGLEQRVARVESQLGEILGLLRGLSGNKGAP
jgi:hypothetical protein